jgi:signal transduction histidine kinase/ActR/RegA family two-component response regulator
MARRALLAQTLLAALAGLALLLWPLAPMQRVWLDLQLRWAAPEMAASGVLVLDIDDASLAALRADFGSWPLPRDAYALVIEALRDAGARAIVIDLVLADPRDGDAALARSLARPGAPVLLAAAGVPGSLTPRLPSSPAGEPAPLAWSQISLPADSLSLAGRPPRAGVVTTPLDPDGSLRHWWLSHASPQGQWPVMPLAVLQALRQPLALRPDAQGRITPLLPRGGVATLPFARVALAAREGRSGDAVLRAAQDQVVFIGASSLYTDAVMTALGQQSGSALLASSYAAMRDGRGLQALPTLAALGLLLLGLLPSLGLLLRGRLRPRDALLAAVAALLLLALLGLWLAPQRGYWMDPGPALLALLLALMLQLAHHQRQTAREAERQLRERQMAEAANAAKSAFLATVSHELRTPLSAVLGLSELLAQSPLNEPQRRQVQLLGSAGRSLLTLIDELLDLSRIDMGRLDLHPEPARLAGLLEDCVALMQARAAERSVHCELLLGPGLPDWVMVDAQRLSQVLLNLLGNAIKFTPQGRVTLHAARLSDDRLQFSVSDTGIGIASSQLQRIFEPFMQAQGHDSTRFGGSGLGLAISRQLVRLMGGDIEVQSVPGAGSRFAFALTLPPAEAQPTPAPPKPAGDADLQLLIAEDDDVVAEVLLAQLAPLGWRIERASNGHLAVALAKRLRFDLILVDVQLPGLDGHRVVRALREHERQQGLPRTAVLALSAHAYADDARASIAAGCDEHLSKPVSQERLLAALRRWAPDKAAARTPPSVSEPAPKGAAAKRRAHAAVFLGNWGAVWAEVRNDPVQAQALLGDLLDCAKGLDDEALRHAARTLQQLMAQPVVRLLQQHQAEVAVQAAVEAALASLTA